VGTRHARVRLGLDKSLEKMVINPVAPYSRDAGAVPTTLNYTDMASVPAPEDGNPPMTIEAVSFS
jgi:hypothetical protein